MSSVDHKRILKPLKGSKEAGTTDQIAPQIPDDEKLSTTEIKEVVKSLDLIHDLKFFLLTAPVNWHENQVIRRYYLNKEEGFVSCVYWNSLYFITGTDIVRSVAYKMEFFGRKIVDRKKLEEGIFSDLRALKCGVSAVLESPKSQFLKFLHRNQCLRTQKKQKVFFWFSVPHDRLFKDALARDLERELAGIPSATVASTKLASSFHYDHTIPLVSQLQSHILAQTGKDFSYILSEDTVESSAAAKANSAPDPSTEQEGTLEAPSIPSFENRSESSASSDSGFPLDYLGDDPFLFNVDGVGSVAECEILGSASNQDFTYTQNPSSAFLPDQPSLWLVSPTGVQLSEDLLLDQATPVVPVFNGGRTPLTATTPRSVWMTTASTAASMASPGFTMFTNVASAEVKVEDENKVKDSNQHAQPSQPSHVYSFLPGASSLAGTGLSSTGMRSTTANVDEVQPQVLTVPTVSTVPALSGVPGAPSGSGVVPLVPTNNGSAISASLQGQFFSPMISNGAEPNMYYYYGCSPCYADFTVLPFSRPISGIKSAFDKADKQKVKSTVNTHSTETGRVGKQKKKNLLNPSLRHLGLELEEREEKGNERKNVKL
ncbi:DEKNAAC101938 [Brettanomyces naardenensis]|uniref:DEKNAAC101938 n=1 Tax=Brettanomyces naardenensis TaxID=13370 RepID=A0A448YJG1_BRENA|nr:DEKNAAC101938 [Brettanomyces naardenensis]